MNFIDRFRYTYDDLNELGIVQNNKNETKNFNNENLQIKTLKINEKEDMKVIEQILFTIDFIDLFKIFLKFKDILLSIYITIGTIKHIKNKKEIYMKLCFP